MNIINVKNIAKSFGENEVLKEISLSLQDGETLVILGGSGSGKSVLMKIIIGLMTADRGEIEAFGLSINKLNQQEILDLRKRTGVLFQGGALFDSMNVYENVAFGLKELTGTIDEKEIREVVINSLTHVGLEGIEDMAISELSGGMKKRVALARAVAMKPEILFYDEPTTGLDPESSRMIGGLITRMKKQLGVSSFVVTHDIELAFSVADRICFLKDGYIAFKGTLEELKFCSHSELCSFIGDFYQRGFKYQGDI